MNSEENSFCFNPSSFSQNCNPPLDFLQNSFSNSFESFHHHGNITHSIQNSHNEMPFLTNEIRPSVFLMQKEEEPQEPQANYCFQIDFKNEPTNAFFRTFMGIINHQLSSSKCTLLETTVVKNIEPKEEIKESDLAIKRFLLISL